MLADFHAPTLSTSAEVEEDGMRTSAGLRQLLNADLARAVAKKAKGPADLLEKPKVPARTANRELLEALDSMLQHGANICLNDFIAPCPPVPLAEHQRRSFVTVPDPLSGAPQRRCVVVDMATGQRQYEVELNYTNGKRSRPTMHASHDLGSVGYPCSLFMLGKLQLRGTFMWDRWHVMMSEMEAAVTAGRMTLIRAQNALGMNLRRGPFKKDLSDSKLLRAGSRFFNSATPRNELFYLFSDDIAHALNFREQEPDGDAWLDDLWAAAKSEWLGSGKGTEVAPSRWWSWEVRAQTFRKIRPITTMILIYYGQQQGWWRTLNDCPVYSHERFADEDIGGGDESAAEDKAGDADGDEDEPADEAPADEMPEGMGKSKARDTLNKRRGATSKSTMKFAACSMCKPLNNRCFEVLAEVPRHVMDRFYKEMKMYKRGPQGCLDLHQELCRGGYVPTIEKLLSHCSEQKFASLLQFKLGRTSPALLKQDRIVAKASWRMVVALAGGLARFSLLYSHFPPYCALALTDECSVTVEKKLAWMKRCWQTLENRERSQGEQGCTGGVARCCLSAAGVLSRDILAAACRRL